MKKEYIIPKIKEYHGEVLLMLSASDTEGDGNQFAREFYFDDEEEEEEKSIWDR